MQRTLKVFLTELIDYAGLFPPANLQLSEAFPKYLAYIQGLDAWMMSRFIIPTARLIELGDNHGTLFPENATLHFSGLGKPSKNSEDYFNNLSSSLTEIRTFHQRFPNRVQVDFFEVKLPGDVIERARDEEIRELLEKSADMIDDQAPGLLNPFYEIDFLQNWRDGVDATTKALAAHNVTTDGNWTHSKSRRAGFKLRCGGIKAEMFPSLEQVAYSLEEVISHDLSFKATAGLHHPIRHYNESVQTKMHGFFNVFGAAVLGAILELKEEKLHKILQDEQASSFVFKKDSFSWKDLSITVEQLETARQKCGLSFGSCSFDEPRDDLKELGLF
ncbi:hypothetical protein K8I28_10535 [bacterium]|nr:hypothetical protein [bacterium]